MDIYRHINQLEPIFVGLFTMLGVMFLGFFVGVLTGFIAPEKVFAQVAPPSVGPPCCVIVPPPPILVLPPVIIPPVLIPPSVGPSCCTIPAPTTPPVATPPPVAVVPPPPSVEEPPPSVGPQCCTLVLPPIVPPALVSTPPIIYTPPPVVETPVVSPPVVVIPPPIVPLPVDLCVNIPGDQINVPDGLEVDGSGNCVAPITPPPPTDVCPNIAGNQADVPAGLVFNSAGDCIAPSTGVLAPVCTLTASPASFTGSGVATLSWTTTNATDFSIDHSIGSVTPISAGSTTTATISSDTTFTGTVVGAGGTASCTAPVTITTGGGGGGCSGGCGGGGGGGGGGGSPNPSVLLSALPHVGEQPLAFLYLSQIPYTGLDLGPGGTVLYWVTLILWSGCIAYLLLFGAGPFVYGRLHRALIPQVAGHHSAPAAAHKAKSAVHLQETSSVYSPYEGFKSFANGEVLTIEDIVKGLARANKSEKTPPVSAAEPRENVEPVYKNVEPIFNNVEEIAMDEREVSTKEKDVSTSSEVRGFVAALVQGDRTAVFEVLRNHIRGGGAPEHFVGKVACMLDDVYRSRVDGSVCDENIARLVARHDTPTLEKIVSALSNAIDSSYSSGITGAKLALARALSTIGA